MTYSTDDSLQLTLQQSLQQIAVQMGQPISLEVAQQLYQEAVELLSHLNSAPITLARVAGTLLVFRAQKMATEERDWFKAQIKAATEPEEIEELIESMHRADAL